MTLDMELKQHGLKDHLIKFILILDCMTLILSEKLKSTALASQMYSIFV